ncbi:MAG: AEC family transporter [Desulfohalobiaceae bacterium]
MRQKLSIMLSALAPVFFIILMGYGLKAWGFPGDPFWGYVERSTYYIFFPALLIHKLAQAELTQQSALPMLAAILLSILILAGLLYLIRPWSGLSGPAFSSVFQGGLRMNTFVGLAGASALLGDQGLTLSALALMGMVPLLNLLCVPTVAGFSKTGQASWVSMGLEIAKNPLILACVAGFGLSLLPFALPWSILQIFDLLGRSALPLGLLAVGAGLQIRALNTNLWGLALSSVVKLLIYPALTALLCSMLSVTGPALTVAVLFSGLPTAASSYILARQLGGDQELMAVTITAQTALSAITLPLVLQLLA